LRKFIIKRFLYSILTIWVVITATFFLMHLMPGNPFSEANEKKLPAEIVQVLNQKYHLDKPVYEQYFLYLKGVVTKFDLGQPLRDTRSVNQIIAEQFPRSAVIGLEATLFALITGVIFGIIGALKKNSMTDYIISTITVLGISIPAYVIALLFQYFIAFQLQQKGIKVLPISGWGDFRYTILPSLAIGVSMMATMTKFMRTSMLDVINQDYIKTAKSKGISSTAVVLRHTVRNAIIPVVTVAGPMLASIVMGTFIIETIFSIPGLGSYFVTSIQNYDYTMIMGTTIFYATFLVFANFIVDILYSLIDPRIRIS
jgi:oligopeptide transport system permease protein